VVDGNRGAHYDRGVNEGSLIFSPDSRRVAYVGATRTPFLEFWNSNDEIVMVLDGQEVKPHSNLNHRSLVFSPNGHLLAYLAGDRIWLVDLDGQELHHDDAFDQIPPVFSPDGQRLAYWASGGVKVVDIDGWGTRCHIPSYRPMSPVFSPDSEHLALRTSHGVHVVNMSGHEEQRYPNYNTVGSRPFVFSPHSRRLAFVGHQNKKQFAIVDGSQQQQYDDVRSVVFSPDGQRVAYIAHLVEREKVLLWDRKVGESCVVVVDGQAGKRYRGIVAPPGGRGIYFDSPDRLHYIARKGVSFQLVEEQLT